jgi:HK97 family phage major capsid protein
MSAQVLDQLVTKQAELSGIVATLANEGRVATDEEKGKLAALKTDIDAIQKSWTDNGRRAFLSSLERQTPREGIVLKSNEPFADQFKGDFDPELEGVSLGRFVRGIATGNWKGAELERKTAMSSSSTAGGYLIPEVLSTRVIDLARNKSFVIQAGVGTVPMTSQTLLMAAVTGDPSVAWYAENATIAETDMTFGRQLFTAHKMAAICRVSNELLEDAQNIDSLIESTLGMAMASELDRASLFGDGIGKPLGIYETDNVGSIPSVGNIADYDDFIEAIWGIRGYNYEPNAAMYSSRTGRRLSLLDTGSSADKQPVPADLANIQRYITNKIANTFGGGSNESVAFIGQWNQYLIALRSDVRLEISRSAGTAFEKDQTLIRVVWRGDGHAIQPRAFSVLSGIN